jgi:hypothetical protein
MTPADVKALEALRDKWRESAYFRSVQGGNTFEMQAHVEASKAMHKCADDLDALLQRSQE